MSTDEKPMPYSMRRVRKAKPMEGTDDAWWYVDKNGIDIYVESIRAGGLGARLTRDQVARALQLMDSK